MNDNNFDYNINDEKSVNEWADEVKRSGSLKKGDWLLIPAGTTQTYGTYSIPLGRPVEEQKTLAYNCLFIVDDVDYDDYRIRPLVDYNKRFSDPGAWYFLRKEVKITMPNGKELITEGWEHFRVIPDWMSINNAGKNV